MNNNLNFQFGMYKPATDSIIVNTGEYSVLIIRCKEYNSSVTFDDPNDIVLNMEPFYHLLVEQMKEKQGVTEKLKAENQMLWGKDE